jgi:amidase
VAKRKAAEAVPPGSTAGGPDGLVGRTAVQLAAAVRGGDVSPSEVLRAHLAQIDALEARVGAFVRRMDEKAVAEAAALDARPDLSGLVLAGVPVAVKDNVPVAGEPTRFGCTQMPETPAAEDHELVRRLREAGAVIVGLTRLPELGVWAAGEDAWGVARNPWDLDLTTGGSSAGSAAAVAAGMVPAAHGNDGLGSIRIPSACCGLFGLKPGLGVVPAGIGRTSWRGLAENGPIATTVGDAALLLSVMAARPELAETGEPERPLRVALSLEVPVPGVRVDPEMRRAARETADALAAAGHRVARADPPYSQRTANAVVAWFTASTADETKGLDERKLEPRQRRHAQVGRTLERLGRVRQKDRDRFKAQAAEFFSRFDVLVTPMMTHPPLAAAGWRGRSWAANVWAQSRWAPFCAPWNFAQYPGASVPAGTHSSGVPMAAQLVAAAGGEALLLQVARQLELARPWPRHAPLAGLPS